ncbi:aspartate aminotransferase family protein [Cohaesibacter gelatinilyticus]|uniref:4-aminobutyrate aminotransferase/diaminobutyrate-pyruvate transaminase/4-aminobutyrate aminotransferase / (S)-3-amino-2-methylpropionate transaminase n=1 Tax=Cohaesibacter gelatinilyticus TaxID=372072 RepID=A0A285NH94_9HYPH|nr:aspartate aminotransferase family protein [Cohaesibacter gelatinilyticus]SNZ08840.1 4-aminobutyrate aminotransferase/diaminobutyrate-pyruvate transaminase/4-aminobutyrate aminotransferase / (S)-3-amino-2-methylpropionate transaminase [Cohaesibacter gelatinilyticus]
MASHIFSRAPQPVQPIETKHRSIKTSIPCPGTADILTRLDATESRSMHGQLPLVWDRANNYNVYDAAGNKWIDFTSCIFVANVGHSNPHLSSSIAATLDRPLYSCYAYGNEIRATYLEKLLEFAGKPFEKAFLLSAGTEATEAALKLIRMHGQKVGKRRGGIVTIQNNWHGRTMGAQMLSSNEGQKSWIGNLDSDIHHIPFPYPWDTNDKTGLDVLDKGLTQLKENGVDLSQDIAGFMLETFQGWGAVFYPKEYVQAIKDICDKYDILLAFDEMQAGFARCGKAFGYEHYEVEPDLICVGKGMGGGVPISGVLGRKHIMDLPDIGNMSSTHSANPMCCAAGLAVLEEIQSKDLVEESRRKGDLLFAELKKLEARFPHRMGPSLGRGLLAAIFLYKPNTREADGPFGSRVCELAMQKGLLMVHTGRESIKLGPPLTIPDDAIIEAMEILGDCIAEVDAMP